MKRALNAALALAMVLSVTGGLVGLSAQASLASFVSDNCYKNQASDPYHRRKDALAYAQVAKGEGYEWGGGCWNNNNRDDTPKAPDSNGEGPDCSGLVFKAWELRNAPNDSRFTWYHRIQNVHGAFSSYDFHSPASSDPFVRLPNKNRSTTMYMDAFAKRGHVGLISSRVPPSSNTDYIIEARGDSSGTGEWLETYRFESAYQGVRRKNWTPDCHPNCRGPESPAVVVFP